MPRNGLLRLGRLQGGGAGGARVRLDGIEGQGCASLGGVFRRKGAAARAETASELVAGGGSALFAAMSSRDWEADFGPAASATRLISPVAEGGSMRASIIETGLTIVVAGAEAALPAAAIWPADPEAGAPGDPPAAGMLAPPEGAAAGEVPGDAAPIVPLPATPDDEPTADPPDAAAGLPILRRACRAGARGSGRQAPPAAVDDAAAGEAPDVPVVEAGAAPGAPAPEVPLSVVPKAPLVEGLGPPDADVPDGAVPDVPDAMPASPDAPDGVPPEAVEPLAAAVPEEAVPAVPAVPPVDRLVPPDVEAPEEVPLGVPGTAPVDAVEVPFTAVVEASPVDVPVPPGADAPYDVPVADAREVEPPPTVPAMSLRAARLPRSRPGRQPPDRYGRPMCCPALPPSDPAMPKGPRPRLPAFRGSWGRFRIPTTGRLAPWRFPSCRIQPGCRHHPSPWLPVASRRTPKRRPNRWLIPPQFRRPIPCR